MAQLNPKSPRVRIAPSPTGNLHVGTARTALFNELFARHHDGTFIVRIEDTDKARSKPEYEANIIEGLQWLGLTWNEGPDVGGKFGPYRQSERQATYETAIRQLITNGKAHFCSCTPQEAGEIKVCACEQDATIQANSDERFAVRLKVEAQVVMFMDMVRGEVSVHTDTFGGSFIIARSVKDPLYHLAVVIDDATMDITHVIRGEDHISNTPKHVLIQRALGYEQPMYAHIPLLLDENRRKLSKRSGETSLLAYRDLGYLPQAVLNYLALLGWNPGDEREFFTHAELIPEFSLERVQKGGAVFSLMKLQAINKYYIRQLTPEELFQAALPFFQKANITIGNPELVKKALVTEQERVATLAELPEAIAFFLPSWAVDFPASMLVWRKSDKEKTLDILKKLETTLQNLASENYTSEALQTHLMAWIDAEQIGRGDTLWPLRVALTGREHSPGPFEVAAVLGREETLRRIAAAYEKLKNT